MELNPNFDGQFFSSMKRFVFFLSLFFLISHNANTQPNTSEANRKRIETYLSSLESVGFNGSVYVGVKDSPFISRGLGYSDKEKKIKNTPSTVFDIGSVTKQFTSAAILKLEMQGRLSTSDKITKYFDNVPADKSGITLHDLLRHQSGLVSNVGRDFEATGKEEFLQKIFSSKLKSSPGTTFSYSNIGYSLLALIIEKVSGQSYESFLYKELWHPAGMEMTGYSRPAFNRDQVATGYDIDSSWGKPNEKAWNGKEPYLHLKGNGGILSTILDLAKWDQALKGEKILSKAAKQKLYHPALREGEDPNSIYAYGWDVSRTERGTTQVWHNGTNHIFYADFLRFIDEDLTLILLTNQSHVNFNNLCFEITRMLFDTVYAPFIPAPDNAVNRAFTEQILTAVKSEGLEKAKSLYDAGKNNATLLEFRMRDAGFEAIDNGQPDTAMRIFEMNVYAYPQNAKALQGLAEGYMETGNKEMALKYFYESRRINPYSLFVKWMIADLEKANHKEH